MSSVHRVPSVVEFTEGRDQATTNLAAALQQAEWVLIEHGHHREQLSHALADLAGRFSDRMQLDPEANDVLARFFAYVSMGGPVRLECYRCGAAPETCSCCAKHRLNDEPGDGCYRCEVNR